MKTTHTPGPWQVVVDPKNVASSSCEVWGPKGPGYGLIASTSPHVMPYPDGSQAADARLIAAAPDLLAACVLLLSRVESDIETDERKTAEGDMARAALAKATK